MGINTSRLKGKNVLVTGAASGIGQAIAVRCAAEGANVAVNFLAGDDRIKDTMAKVQEASKTSRPDAKLVSIPGDISAEDQVQKAFSMTIEQLGGLDVLVNNAGIQIPSASHEVQMSDYDKVIGINLRGAFMCAREALRYFVSKNIKGVILNNSSVHEIIPRPRYVTYSISKGGMENMTKTLALEYAEKGIRVNAVGPGAIITPINDAWAHDPAAAALVNSHIPLGRAGNAEEIASVFAFLASDDASYITGQTLFADGGLTLYPEFRSSWSGENVLKK